MPTVKMNGSGRYEIRLSNGEPYRQNNRVVTFNTKAFAETVAKGLK